MMALIRGIMIASALIMVSRHITAQSLLVLTSCHHLHLLQLMIGYSCIGRHGFSTAKTHQKGRILVVQVRLGRL